jgi:DNA invertase Pin-like site-specific DNA recombinase
MRAFAYLRTSSVTNVGTDKDSDKRQRLAIDAYAAANAIEVAGEFYDAAVRGTDPITARPGFAAMLSAIAENSVRTILVETVNRFARDLIVQETGFTYLRNLGVTLIATDDPHAFTSDTPTAVLIRQILGAVAQFEKASLVAKLKGARDRKRQLSGRCEGWKPAPESARAMARELRAQNLPLRAIAAQLAVAGYLAPSGKPYLAGSIAAMLKDSWHGRNAVPVTIAASGSNIGELESL